VCLIHRQIGARDRLLAGEEFEKSRDRTREIMHSSELASSAIKNEALVRAECEGQAGGKGKCALVVKESFSSFGCLGSKIVEEAIEVKKGGEGFRKYYGNTFLP